MLKKASNFALPKGIAISNDDDLQLDVRTLVDETIVRITVDDGAVFRFSVHHGQLILKPDSYTGTIKQKESEYAIGLCWMASIVTPAPHETVHSSVANSGDSLQVSAIGARGSLMNLGQITNIFVHKEV